MVYSRKTTWEICLRALLYAKGVCFPPLQITGSILTAKADILSKTRMWVAPSLSSGLGNRLFQYAAAAGAAEQWNRELVFYMPRCKESPHGSLSSIFKLFPSVRMIEHIQPYKEFVEPPRRFYQYIPLGQAAPSENILVSGFRQSPLYFPKKITPDWDSALGGPVIRRKVETLAGLNTFAERKQTYAIHVRLGDYKYLLHHQVNLSNYYRKALEKVPRGSRLHLFSDEPDLCRNMFLDVVKAKELQLTLAVTHSDIESLYEMSLCLGGTITANSTFSWWGAWFAHAEGAEWATYPETMGDGQPEAVDLFPEWGTVIRC
jgi:hypothetical protein